MSFQGFCPQCNRHIPQERYATGSAVCECGWFDTQETVKKVKASEKKSIGMMIVSYLVLSTMAVLFLEWGPHAITIPFIKIGQFTGVLSNQGYRDLVATCSELGKWDCAKDAYIDLYHASGDVTVLNDLATLQFRLGETEPAGTTLATYFKAGGKDGEAMIRYAMILEGQNQMELALQMYDDSILARPEILPVHATSGIVRILMKQGRYAEARTRILAFHESAGNAKGYLNTELTSLDAKLGEQNGNGKSHKSKSAQS